MSRVIGMSKIVETMITNKAPSKWCVVYNNHNKSVRLESSKVIIDNGEYIVAYEDEEPSLESLKKAIEDIIDEEIELVKGF